MEAHFIVRFGIADQAFLEKRRRGLARFINFVANHASFRDDKEVVAFLREQGVRLTL
jgi:hypothetical protein